MADWAAAIASVNGFQFLLVDSLDVFNDSDLGDFAGQLGVLVTGFGRLHGDFLVDELVFQSRRIELADDLALLDGRTRRVRAG